MNILHLIPKVVHQYNLYINNYKLILMFQVVSLINLHNAKNEYLDYLQMNQHFSTMIHKELLLFILKNILKD